MALFTHNDAKVLMPKTIADGMIKGAQRSSVVAALSGREPQKFGEVEYMIFDEKPKAEYVDAGQEKSSSKGSFRSVRALPRKVQVTQRFHEEVEWADEDHQLEILKTLSAAGAESLGVALDLGLIHAINPLSGTKVATIDNHISKTTSSVAAATGEADQVIRSAAGLLINRQNPITPTGIAIDPRYTWELSNLQTKLANGDASGVQRYPNLGLGSDISSFLGLQAAQSSTVSAQPEAADTKIRAIVGDFQSGIRWGIQKDIPAEIIRFGDPDGGGDLKRKNEIALRMEIVYGWYVFEDRFATVKVA